MMMGVIAYWHSIHHHIVCLQGCHDDRGDCIPALYSPSCCVFAGLP